MLSAASILLLLILFVIQTPWVLARKKIKSLSNDIFDGQVGENTLYDDGRVGESALYDNGQVGENTLYVDFGSTGYRFYILKINPTTETLKTFFYFSVLNLKNIVILKNASFVNATSNLAKNPEKTAKIFSSSIAEFISPYNVTGIYILATCGVRDLPKNTNQQLMDVIRRKVCDKCTEKKFSCEVRTITGEEEALFAFRNLQMIDIDTKYMVELGVPQCN
jgi:hypothetical protein